ncbi:acyltransferase [Anthocerotibacter panamensis]|uniref:acyltransferase n=1 Tax=Anthocerotibacter panamensis TaxID=2857077 RepID=UPI001C404B4E|nr:hypothetical protein [Anthocerotibacter panamensis]
MKQILKLVSVLLPWPLRRWLLQTVFGYKIHPTSRIGLCWIWPQHLILEEHSRIGHLTVCKGLDLLHLMPYALIGRGNWITGFPSGPAVHFSHQPERVPQLVLGAHSAITNRHLIDCTSSVTIGSFTTFAGFQSQILTHSIDLAPCRQSSAPVVIGDYCFIGTNCVLLGGSTLPNFSVLGAKSLLNKAFTEPYYLYAGVPARPVKAIPREYAYFSRPVGFVN